MCQLSLQPHRPAVLHINRTHKQEIIGHDLVTEPSQSAEMFSEPSVANNEANDFSYFQPKYLMDVLTSHESIVYCAATDNLTCSDIVFLDLLDSIKP